MKKPCKECPHSIRNRHNDMIVDFGKRTGKRHNCHMTDGVKHAYVVEGQRQLPVKDTIQNGVKHCEDGDWLDGDERFEDIIQNGVKEIGHKKTPDESFTNHIIEDGVKEIHDDCSNNIGRVEGIIRVGKEN